MFERKGCEVRDDCLYLPDLWEDAEVCDQPSVATVEICYGKSPDVRIGVIQVCAWHWDLWERARAGKPNG